MILWMISDPGYVCQYVVLNRYIYCSFRLLVPQIPRFKESVIDEWQIRKNQFCSETPSCPEHLGQPIWHTCLVQAESSNDHWPVLSQVHNHYNTLAQGAWHINHMEKTRFCWETPSYPEHWGRWHASLVQAKSSNDHRLIHNQYNAVPNERNMSLGISDNQI